MENDRIAAHSVPRPENTDSRKRTMVVNNRSTSDSDSSSDASSTRSNLTGTASPGVKWMQIVKRYIEPRDRYLIFISLFLIAFVYNLDGSLRYVYQPYATAGFSTHSTLAAVNVLRSVIAAAAQPTTAKLADVFGRQWMILVSAVLYIAEGTIADAWCHNVEGFATGAVFYQIGYTMMLLLVEVIIADITSTQSRLFFSFVPTFSFVIITWVSGDISSAILKVTTWRWGIFMWGIIYAAMCIPLAVSLWLPYQRAKADGAFKDYNNPYTKMPFSKLAITLFYHLDIIGLLGLIAVFGLVLVPLTLAGGTSSTTENWGRAYVVAPLVVGLLCVPAWIAWEAKYARHPLVPFRLLRDRGVWAPLGMACMLTFCWALQGDFLYTVLVVAFGESIKSATRIAGLYTFASVLTGTILGLVVRYVKRLKAFIVIGTFLFFISFGLLYRYRGGSGHAGMIGAQIVLGVAGGLFSYPGQVSIQVATQHEHLAVVTGLYLATFNIGAALGNSVSGAIWTQTLIPTLLKNLPPPYNTPETAHHIYSSPFEYATNYTTGTPLREGIVKSYMHTQRLLTLTGLILCILLILFSALIRDPELSEEQSLTSTEVAGSGEDVTEVNETRLMRLRRLWR